jgi:hypothetical protein
MSKDDISNFIDNLSLEEVLLYGSFNKEELLKYLEDMED